MKGLRPEIAYTIPKTRREWMNLSNEYWLKISLQLKLRQSSGDDFQNFHSDIMEKIHGDDFVRVRPFGQLGDKGCDGYLKSTGVLFQCYGAVNGDKSKVKNLIGKMEADFSKAKENLSDIMKQWYMVHNLVDGLPVEAIQVLNKLETENPDLTLGFVGREGFENLILQLNEEDVIELLGPVATNEDSRNLQLPQLKALIDAVVTVTKSGGVDLEKIGPVPVDKLDANQLPDYWKKLIEGGWQNAYIVAGYLDKSPDPLIGEAIADLFKAQYEYLKAQMLSPESIMENLYEFITGIGTVPTARQVASQALLAYLFESCDIFENESKAAKA